MKILITGSVSFIFIFSSQLALSQHREIDSLENTLQRKDDTIKVLNLVRLSELYQEINQDKSSSLAREALKLSEDLSYERGEYIAIGRISALFEDKGDLLSALKEAQRQLEVAQRTRNIGLIAKSYTQIGNIFNYLEQAPKAIEAFIKAHRHYEEIGDKRGMARVLNGLGNACARINDLNQAERYYRQALEIAKQLNITSYVIRLLINIGETLTKGNKYDESLIHYFEALKFAEDSNDEEAVAYILMSIGEVYNRLNNDKASTFYEMASGHYDKIIKEGKSFNQPNKATCLIGLGDVLIKKEQYKKAIDVLNEAIDLIKDKDYFLGLVRANAALSLAYAKLGNYEKAFDHRTKQFVASDSLNGRRQKDKSREIQTRFQIEESEKQLATMQKEQAFSRMVITLSSGLILVSALGVILFIGRLRLRIRKDRELAKLDQQRYETELKAKQLIEKQLRQELEFKTSELTTYTLHMIQKNEILDVVKREVDEIGKDAPDDVRSKINRLLNSINLSHRNDRDWESFKLYFDQVHKGFFDNLGASYPDLNGKDLKLCALLKLNLDTKQIATILDISPDSAKVARHRIRKKMGLTTDDNLYNFLNSL